MFSVSKQKDIDISVLANQLHGMRIARSKIPSWYEQKKLIYPSKVSMEQCSSELTAHYKSILVKGKSFIDLTGGFGIDSFFISKSFENGIHCEIDTDLQYIAQNNFKQLSSKIHSVKTDGIDYLNASNDNFDLIYIDPSRRNSSKQKVIQLKDYTPNILEHLNLLHSKGKVVLLKTAPLLDIKQVLQQISSVKEVHVVAVNNECKELLFLIEENSESNIKIQCSDLTKKVSFQFYFKDEDKKCFYSSPLRYIYEPNASILKAGAFNSIANQLNLKKIHKNSHIYTSDILIENFPGRKFELKHIKSLDKKEILPLLKDKKANITRRNFPLSVADIRKKIGVKDGGNDYLFATTLIDDKKKILICEKI